MHVRFQLHAIFSATNNSQVVAVVCSAYFDKYAELEDSTKELKPSAQLASAEIEFLAGGGLVVDKISSDVTHVIVHSAQ